MSNSASVTCPACQKRFAFRPQLAGKRVKCRNCGHQFLVSGPDVEVVTAAGVGTHQDASQEDSYDLAPASAPAPRPNPSSFAPVQRQTTRPAPKAESTLINSGVARATLNASLRYGPLGALAGLAGFGAILLMWKGRRFLLYAFCVVGILLIIFLSGIMFLGWLAPRLPSYHRAAPQGPMAAPVVPAMPPMPAGIAGRGTPPTYESLVQRFGAEHVFRMNVSGIRNAGDAALIRGFVSGRGPGNWSIETSGDEARCLFYAPFEFDTLQHMVGFATIISADPNERTLNIKMRDFSAPSPPPPPEVAH